MRLLSARELGLSLGMDEETAEGQVRGLEASGLLFSVGLSRHGTELAYPACQVGPGVAGRPLEAVLEVLKRRSPERDYSSGCDSGPESRLAWAFLGSSTDLLGGLTPVEVLIGRPAVPRALEAWVWEALKHPAETRLQGVLATAKAFVDQMEAG